jgi:hypothetical protein
MKTIGALTFLLLMLSYVSVTNADTFGNGVNTFEIAFVRIGNPGNPADTTGDPNPAGSVPYTYRIGKYEISEDMIDKANALGSLGITHDNRGANKPATSISWFEAAKFVNWFQIWETGDAGFNPNNQFRNRLARYVLPSIHEWYKAAYYDPMNGVYYDYPTGSDNIPDGIDFAGDPAFDAVIYDGYSGPQPNNFTDVGVLSPYGTAGQGGNVYEIEETEYDLVNDSILSARELRGAGWMQDASGLLPTNRSGVHPAFGDDTFGFRVASIPEPSVTALVGLAILGFTGRRLNR